MDNKIESMHKVKEGILRFFETFIYGGRWVIAPMYVGLLVTLGVYTYNFLHQMVELLLEFRTISESILLLKVLSLVDILMIGNLIIMIMVGGYHIFVRRFKVLSQEDRPQWLEHISSGSLKVKMGMSLIGVSSIHLLKDFVESGSPVDWSMVGKHAGIHVVFIGSTIALAYVDKLINETTPAQKHTEQSTPAQKKLLTEITHA